jgi:hypothetical protein
LKRLTPESSIIIPSSLEHSEAQLDLPSSASNPIQQLGVNIGPAQLDRYVVVTWYAASVTVQVSSMTIGGVAATALAIVSLTGIHSGIFLAQVPSGTTADIVATYPGSPNNIASFAVYTVTGSGGLPLAVLNTAQLFNSSGALTKSFTTATNGFVIAHIGYSSAANQAITTSMAQDGARVSSSNRSWYGHSTPAGSSVTLALASFAGNKSLLGASFGI